jgi:hypothetical protein
MILIMMKVKVIEEEKGTEEEKQVYTIHLISLLKTTPQRNQLSCDKMRNPSHSPIIKCPIVKHLVALL